MLRTSWFFFAVSNLLIVFSCASIAAAADVEVERFDKTFQISGRPKIVIENQDGSTTVKAVEGNSVAVHVVKRVVHARNEEEAQRIAARVKVRVEQNGNQIDLITEYPKSGFDINFGRSPRVLVDFDVTAPRESDLQVHESDGPLEVRGFSGNIDLRASDGRVTAEDCSGTVSIATSDGDIAASRVQGKLKVAVADGDITLIDGSGSLNVRASDGDARLSNFNGEVQARTADGKLFIDGVITALTAKTSDGSMQIRLAPGSAMEKDWSIRSADGDVEINLPSSFSAELDLETADGHIETQLPIAIVGSVARDHVHGKMNEGGRLLMIHTSDGDISINAE